MNSKVSKVFVTTSALLVIFSSSALPVFAKEGGFFGNFMNRFENRKDNFQDHQDKVKERHEENQASREASKGAKREDHIKRLKEVFTKILNRMTLALERLINIQGRIENRITKLESEGKDVSTAKSALDVAKIKKAAAQAAIDTAKANIGGIDTSSTTRETVLTSVANIKNAKRALQDYHRSLKDVVKILRGLSGKEATKSAK